MWSHPTYALEVEKMIFNWYYNSEESAPDSIFNAIQNGLKNDMQVLVPIENSEEIYGNLEKVIKTKNSYEIYYKNAEGKFRIIFKKLEGLGVEDYEYFDTESGHKFVIKDSLESLAKTLDAIDTKDLPKVSNRYKMMFRIIIK